jgi:hypothetical protein
VAVPQRVLRFEATAGAAREPVPAAASAGKRRGRPTT